TQSAVAMGQSPASAGLLLAVGSVAGIITRIATGILADRDGGQQFGVISWMLAAGAVAMVLGAGGAGPLLVAGTIGTFAAGWGWSGLLFLSLVRASPGAPGAAAGVGVAGLAAGNGLGPLLFGVIAQTVSFSAAWASAATLAALSAVLMRLASSRFLAAGSGNTPPSSCRPHR
ncbi:MAG: MFS transporter, partial [Egibacteraceae bacterium]